LSLLLSVHVTYNVVRMTAMARLSCHSGADWAAAELCGRAAS
jgi:hypothetical protein